jgi:hypothetical protein
MTREAEIIDEFESDRLHRGHFAAVRNLAHALAEAEKDRDVERKKANALMGAFEQKSDEAGKLRAALERASKAWRICSGLDKGDFDAAATVLDEVLWNIASPAKGSAETREEVT